MSNYSIENKLDKEKAEEVVAESLEKCMSELPKTGDLHVTIEKVDEEDPQHDFINENMGGVHGYTQSRTEIVLKVIPENKEWKNKIKALTAHEYAHSFFFEEIDQDSLDYRWQHVLFEAHSQNFAKKVYPGIDVGMREHLTKKEVSEHWKEVRDEWFDRETAENGDPLFHPFGKFPTWLGYSMAYYIGRKLLNQGHKLEKFPQIEKEEVVKAGNQIYL